MIPNPKKVRNILKRKNETTPFTCSYSKLP